MFANCSVVRLFVPPGQPIAGDRGVPSSSLGHGANENSKQDRLPPPVNALGGSDLLPQGNGLHFKFSLAMGTGNQ